METRFRIRFAPIVALLALGTRGQTAMAQISCPNCHIPNIFTCQSSYPIPDVIVGSPSGQVGTFVVGLHTGTDCHLLTRSDMPNNFLPQIWLAIDGDFCAADNLRLLDNLSGALHCNNENTTECALDRCVTWPYLEADENPATFHPRFGGFGQISLQLELPCKERCSSLCPTATGFCPGYTAFKCVEARSTDFDANAITDQTEKITLGQELLLPASQRAMKYDFNLDAVVDAADYRIVCVEMQTEIDQGHPTLYTCDGSCLDSCSPYAVSGTFVPDESAPGAVTLALSGSGTSVTLSWASPGNDTYNGQQLGVAKEFILRGSASPITTSNFDSGTAVAGLPAPDLPGTSQQISINACSLGLKYFALKTRDYSGNTSAMSNVVVAPPNAITDLGVTVHCTSIDLTWTAPGSGCPVGAAASYDLRESRSAINEANFSSAALIFSGPAGSPGSPEFVNVGVGACSGRWYFAVKAVDDSGRASAISNVPFGGTPCRNCDDGFAARRLDLPLALAAPTPTPATAAVTIRYSVPLARAGEPLELAVFDPGGRRIRTLRTGAALAGESMLSWDLRAEGGQPSAPGAYFLRLRLGSDVRTRTLMVLR